MRSLGKSFIMIIYEVLFHGCGVYHMVSTETNSTDQ